MPLDGRQNVVLSFAQFRPEKEHLKQLEIWNKVLASGIDATLVMVGSVRDNVPGDQEIVDQLQSRALSLGISDKVRIEVNKPRERILELFSKAKVAIHTMKYEHFGIAVVELMAAGIITVAHKSAGPQMDIIGASKEPVGYLADTVDEYAFYVKNGLKNFDSKEHKEMRVHARAYVEQRFGPDVFDRDFAR
jgi:alpha-1,2-mannosyltransferase